MTGHNTALLMISGATGTVIAATVGGPLSEVFSELSLVTAIMGAGGGLTLGLSIRNTPPREVARGVVLGGLLAWGLGIFFSPAIVQWALGIDIPGQGRSVAIISGSSFIVGFAQDLIFASLLKWREKKNAS